MKLRLFFIQILFILCSAEDFKKSCDKKKLLLTWLHFIQISKQSISAFLPEQSVASFIAIQDQEFSIENQFRRIPGWQIVKSPATP